MKIRIFGLFKTVGRGRGSKIVSGRGLPSPRPLPYAMYVHLGFKVSQVHFSHLSLTALPTEYCDVALATEKVFLSKPCNLNECFKLKQHLHNGGLVLTLLLKEE